MDEIRKFYKNKKVFVTGTAEFKSAWLCSWLIKIGAKVFEEVEEKSRFVDTEGIPEICLQCTK